MEASFGVTPFSAMMQMFRRWAWSLDRRPICGVNDPEMGACFEPKGHSGEHNWR